MRSSVRHDDWVEDVDFSQDGKYLVTVSHDRTAQIRDLTTICVPRNVRIDAPRERPWSPPLWCKEPFYKQQGRWRELTPHTRSLLSDSVRAFLNRFSKPGGLSVDDKEQMSILIAILADPRWRAAEPDAISAVLSNVLVSSNLLYEALLKEFPELLKDKAKFLSAVCECIREREV